MILRKGGRREGRIWTREEPFGKLPMARFGKKWEKRYRNWHRIDAQNIYRMNEILMAVT